MKYVINTISRCIVLAIVLVLFIGETVQAQENKHITLNYHKVGIDTVDLIEFEITDPNLVQIVDSFLEEFDPCLKEAKDCMVILSLARKKGCKLYSFVNQ